MRSNTVEYYSKDAATVRAFQETFPDGAAGKLIAEVMQREQKYWEEILLSLGASNERVRQAQGGIAAIMHINDAILTLLRKNPDEDEEATTEIEEDDNEPIF